MQKSIFTYFSISLLLFLFFSYPLQAQKRNKEESIYVDKKGVIRYKGSNKEASFFGVNYTTPFAYGFRSQKALNVNLEEAIKADVYHMARLGLNAFRVHVWDAEISDSVGNLINNEHLRLFDFLIAELAKRNIKTLITPIAFWGNGYPEKDEKTLSFSNVYGKGPSVVDEAPIQAQERYLKQFFEHVNPYTGTTYGADGSVVAMEINNEPHHSGPKARATEYINRLAAAVKSTGWKKPIFYNISESPRYSDAVVKSNVDGHSFQWYPTGLVANHELGGNYLPNVDQYAIPFDSIAQFKNRAKIVYEFDAGDVLQSNMYPAMARSFRGAGFQWATQFAYDPMATAYANTEYQTHYLNLAYTPSKAISLMIAAKAFRQLPRLKSYGTYPADSSFDVFRVSYLQNLSEMNSENEFYYSNTTTSLPKNIKTLQHIAGVGSSPIIKYTGTGAYFLDKVEEGIWRLEVMPDAIVVSDPFEKASPKKEVVRIQWTSQQMEIDLEQLGANFNVQGVNSGNSFTGKANGKSVNVNPGTFILSSEGELKTAVNHTVHGIIGVAEFVAPQPFSTDVIVYHTAASEAVANKPFYIKANIAGLNADDKVLLEVRHTANKWKTVPFTKGEGYTYKAEVPAEIMVPGLLSYRIMVQKETGDYIVYLERTTEDPYAWDAYKANYYHTYVMGENAPLTLFSADDDRSRLNVYNPDWRNISFQYITGETTQLNSAILFADTIEKSEAGWQLFVGNKVERMRIENLVHWWWKLLFPVRLQLR